MYGKLYGVGVGPGDPELLTLKAVRIMKECDMIALPSSTLEKCVAYQIALLVVPELSEKEILTITMPMVKDETILMESHQKGAELLASHLKEGKNIAFLTLGDPCVYSTYLYVQKRVEKMGFSTEFINGIPSFCAAAAKLNISLAEKEQPVTIIPGSYPMENLITQSGTKVLMKSGKNIGQVKEILSKTDLDVYLVENCGMKNEAVYHGADEIPETSSYYSLIIAKDAK